MENTLYYGDNLDILRRYIPDESVDLVYLDPPFRSNQNYNIFLPPDKPGEIKEVLIQIKAGYIPDAHVRDLGDIVQRENADVDILISMETPERPMKTEAVLAGFYESGLWGKKNPKIQLLTIEELLNDKMIEMPPIRQAGATFKRAQRHEAEQGKQLAMPKIIEDIDLKED